MTHGSNGTFQPPQFEEDRVEVLIEKKVSIKSINIPSRVLVGLNSGYAKQNIHLRLGSRQALAMRCLVEGWEHEHGDQLLGRRANEQDFLRHFLDAVADKLNLPK